MTGVLFGALAAVVLGVNTILIALSARWWGVWRTTAATLVIAFVALLAFAGATGTAIPLDAGGLLPLMAVLGFAAGASYFASHQSLKLGPVSVVSPIGTTTGAMTVVFAFAFLGERPGLIQWIGIPVATLGILFLSLEFRPGGQARLIGWGPMFAVLGVVTGAVSNAGLRIPVRDIGPLPAIITQRFFTVAYLLIVMVFVIRSGRSRKEDAIDRPAAAANSLRVPVSVPKSFGPKALILLTVGLLDAIAFVAFAQGLARAPAWLIGLLSQSGRVIAVAGGYFLFHERLRPSQWIGVLLTVVGLVLAVL